MGLLNAPDCGFAATVKVPDIPEGIVTASGDALNDTVVVDPVVLVQLGL
jgi:hypothetical protein